MNEVRNMNAVKTTLLYLALCTAAFFNTIQDICSPFSHSMNFGDGAIYQYIGKMILNGESPYKDAFDHKGPVLYFINAISVVINEKTGIWLVDLAFMIILYLATFSLCRKICKKGMFTAAFLAIAVLSGTANLYWIGNTPDFFALCIIMVETYVLVDAYEHNKMSFQKAFVIGILISLCFWMKFTTIALAGIFCLGVLIAYAVAKDGKSVANSTGGFLCGFLIVSFPIILWLYSNGAMDDFFKDYVYFNLFYGKMERAGMSRLRALFYFITDGNYVIAICSTIVYLFVRCENKGFFKDSKKKQDYLFVVAIIALIIQTIVCIMPGRSYRQYAAAYYPSFIILISMATRELVEYETPEIKKIVKIAMAGVVGCTDTPQCN